MNQGIRPPQLMPVHLGAPSAPRKTDKAIPPSLAQFAVNQTLHRASSPPSAAKESNKEGALTKIQPDSATLPSSNPSNPLRALSIYRDDATGKFVSIVRDVASGDVVEQIPEEKMMQFFARLQEEKQSLSLPSPGGGLNMEA